MTQELSRLRRNMLSFSAMVFFFLAWEVICRVLGVSELVLPVPARSLPYSSTRCRSSGHMPSRL